VPRVALWVRSGACDVRTLGRNPLIRTLAHSRHAHAHTARTAHAADAVLRRMRRECQRARALLRQVIVVRVGCARLRAVAGVQQVGRPRECASRRLAVDEHVHV
jgi:hypothetical protein